MYIARRLTILLFFAKTIRQKFSSSRKNKLHYGEDIWFHIIFLFYDFNV